MAAILLAAEQIGAATKCLDLTVEYTKDRVQFGRPIGSFQALKHRMADLYVAVQSARAVVNDAIAEPSATSAALARVAASEAFSKVAAEAVQMHGGIAITWEHDIQLYFKRAHGSAQLTGPAAGASAPARIRSVLTPVALDRLQRVAQREPLGVLDEPPFTVVPDACGREAPPRRGVVLDEHGELQARREDRGDDSPKPMAPLPSWLWLNSTSVVDIRSGDGRNVPVPAARNTGSASTHSSVRSSSKASRHRMSLTQEKPATRAQ